MSIPDILPTAVSTLALSVSVVAAVFSYRQAREMREQTQRLQANVELSTAQIMQAGFQELTRAYLEYPRLRSLFYEDETPTPPAAPSGDDQTRARALAEHHLDIFSLAAYRNEAATAMPPAEWEAYILDAFHNSKFLTDHAVFRAPWYHPSVGQAARRVAASRSTDA